MARRATSSTKGRTAPQGPAAEPAAAKAQRRGNEPKLRDMPPADMSVTDAFFPGAEEPVASAAGSASNQPAKARRGRKPRSIELAAEISTTGDDGAQEITAPVEAIQAAEKNAGTDSVAAPAARSSTSLASVAPKAASSAARWNADTGMASFDWPVIEAVAATTGPNQAMAKLLLAARAEGANSRWPF